MVQISAGNTTHVHYNFVKILIKLSNEKHYVEQYITTNISSISKYEMPSLYLYSYCLIIIKFYV